jgi:ankyrin repeat protein
MAAFPLVTPTPTPPLPDECLALICQHLSMFEWPTFASINPQTAQIVQQLFFQQAQMWGYEVEDRLEGSRWYRAQVVSELVSCDLFSQYSVLEKNPQRTPQERLKFHISALTNLDQTTLINILNSPQIYCLEKTKKIVVAALEKLKQWDPDNPSLNNKLRLNTALGMATVFQDTKIISCAFKLGADPNQPIDLYWNIKSYLLCYPTLKFKQTLLDRGTQKFIDIIAQENSEYENYTVPPLHYAVHLETDTEIVSLLLKNKANPNIQGSHENSPLSLAIVLGNYPLALTLLAHGANVNQPGWLKVTPFYYACERLSLMRNHATMQDIQFINQLVTSYGADWQAADQKGTTPAQLFLRGAEHIPPELRQLLPKPQ